MIFPNAVCTPVEVRASSSHGYGLFANEFIPKGTVWWRATESNVLLINHDQYRTLAGSTLAESVQGFLESIHTYCFYEREYDSLVLILDETRHINHSFSANAGGGQPMQSIALEDIQAGEEILEDYTIFDRCPWLTLYGEFGASLYSD